jgi:hypothetical protein
VHDWAFNWITTDADPVERRWLNVIDPVLQGWLVLVLKNLWTP